MIAESGSELLHAFEEHLAGYVARAAAACAAIASFVHVEPHTEAWIAREVEDRLESPRRLFHPFVAFGLFVRHWMPPRTLRRAYVDLLLACDPECMLERAHRLAEEHVVSHDESLGTALSECDRWSDAFEALGDAPFPEHLLIARDDLESYLVAHRMSGAPRGEAIAASLQGFDRAAVEHLALYGREASSRRLLTAASLDCPLAWWGAMFEA